MAKSKLIANRRKTSTILSSKRTVEDAIAKGDMIASAWFDANQNDPRLNQLQNIIDHLSSLLNMSPQDMRQQGVNNIEEFFDDSVKPDVAQTVKREVGQIAQWTQEQRPPAGSPTPEQQGVGYAPDQAVADRGIHASEEETEDMKKANGGSFFSTDRDEKGEPKAPEKVMVPRLAKKKKEAVPEEPIDAAPVAEEPMAAPAPAPAAPAAAPVAGGSAIDYIPTETLIKVVQDLSKELSDAAQGGNKAGVEDAIIEITNVLKARPVLPPEQPEVGKAPAQSSAPALSGGAAAPAPEPAGPAAPLPVAASKKADYGDHAMGGDGSIGNAGIKSPSVKNDPIGVDPAQNNPAPAKSEFGLGGLEIASSLEEKKWAEDYRLHDYKLLDQDEGIVPAGQLPNADEQANRMHPEEHEMEACMSMDGSMEKEAVTPPGISEKTMHKLKEEYPGDKSKAYATAWSIHNKKESALKTLEAAARLYSEVSKIAAGGAEGNWVNDIDEKGQVIEDGGRTPEVGQAHAAIDEAGAALNRPATVPPIKLKDQAKKTAAEMTTSKAVKEAERLGNDLKKMYLDAKSLTGINDTRAVREAVEGIFHAADRFDEAAKVLNKQQQQEESEAEAQEMKAKNKKSSLGGLAVAAGE